MADFFYDGSSEFDREFCEVNEWGMDDDVVSYDSGSGFGGGAAYHDFYEMASYELNWNHPSPQSAVCKVDTGWGRRIHEAGSAYATPIEPINSPWKSERYDEFFYREESLRGFQLPWDSDAKRSVFPSNTYSTNELPWGSIRYSQQTSNCQGMISNREPALFSYFEHRNDDIYADNCDHSVAEITGVRNGEYEHDFDCVMSNDGCMTRDSDDSYVEHTVVCDDNADFANFGNSTVAQSTVLYEQCIAGQLDFDSKLELCVKEHELWVKEHELWVQERAIIRKDLDSLRSRLDRLIEEEKCKELEATQQCVEKHKLGDDAVFMDDQGLEEDDIKLIDNAGFIINQESKQNENIMEVEGSQGNEGKMEPSIGLKAAMRCLELQRKFWDIGSFFSLIPAVPIHHFDDPFLLGAKGVHGVPSAYEAACFGEVYSSGLSYFLSSLGAANKGTSKHSFLPYGNELPVTLRRLLMVSWKQHLQSEWIDTIPSTGHALWRPPDTRVQVNDSLVHLLAILIAWGTVWRPPDTRITVYDCLYHLLIWAGFWFSCWRPPDGVGALGFSFCPPCSFEVEAFQSGMD